MPIDRNNAQYITGAIYKPTQTSAPGVWDLDDQANNIVKNLWPLPPQAVQRSLRFNSADSTYLNRTFVTGTRTTWTWSGWIKRTKLGVENDIFGVRVDGDNQFRFYFNSSDKIDVYNQITASIAARLITTQVFRDPSAWFHIVLTIDTTNGTAGDRFRLYVNGSEITAFDTDTQPSSSYQTFINSANPHYLGYFSSSSLNAYLADVNFIDGQALTPTSFGETDQQTGVWIPKRYTGTYGTNGFRLSFANNSSTTALGYDSSGQGNNWTANNFSVTPGVGNDSLLDVPSLYGTDTGLGGEVLGNYCTWNPNDKDANVTIANGNLDLTAYNQSAYATWPLYSGKWYYEITLIDPYNGTFGSYWGYHGLYGVQRSSASLNHATFTGIYCNTSNDGDVPGVYTLGSRTLVYRTFANNDILGFAVDIDARTMTIYKNGLILSANITIASSTPMYIGSALNGTAGDPGTVTANFGQRPFTYTAPSGYKALCTTNLPAPAIGQTSSNQADNHFAIATYLGNGTSVTVSGLEFSPDFVWMKARNGAYQHGLFDRLRGNGIGLVSNSGTVGETSYSACTFTNDGFINGTDYNGSGTTYVAWCWNAGGVSVTNSAGANGATIASTYRANKSAGFSIVTFTGNGQAGATIAHGLGKTPAFIIVKRRDGAADWPVWHKNLTASTGTLWLNYSVIETTYQSRFNSSGMNSNVLAIGSSLGEQNTSNQTYVAYCWTDIPGYSAFGSFSGTGSTDGAFVYTGFRPAFVMVKTYLGATDNWYVDDVKRDTYNMSGLSLMPNLANAEAVSVGGAYSFRMDMLSNGFKIRENYATTVSFIYAAFAETPARLSTAR